MTLLVLTYHRAHAAADGNSPEMLDAHFECIAAGYPNVLPGERLPSTGPAVCLSFDGGYFDFYATVFPLLKKHGLRAVLAVSPAVIGDRTTNSDAERLRVSSEQAYTDPASGGFCTWCELEEMVRSQHVVVGAHGFTHALLNEPDADLETEVHVPRTLLGARLNTAVETFVFPSGRFNRRSLGEAKTGYPYVFGNGDASNHSWHHRVLHRVTADALRTPREPFEPGRLLTYRTRALWQRLRRC